jgi:hypothetical protein
MDIVISHIAYENIYIYYFYVKICIRKKNKSGLILMEKIIIIIKKKISNSSFEDMKRLGLLGGPGNDLPLPS